MRRRSPLVKGLAKVVGTCLGLLYIDSTTPCAPRDTLTVIEQGNRIENKLTRMINNDDSEMASPVHRNVAHIFDALLIAFFFWHAWWLLRSPLSYVPDDALFYYQLGFNASHGQGVRFNDLSATNGFHPLWLVVCSVLGLFCSTKFDLLRVGTAAVVLLNGCAALCVRQFLRREVGPVISTAGTLIAVPYLFFVGHAMEGSLAACLFAALLLVARDCLERPRSGRFIASAALCGLVVAARLDFVFFVAPVALVLAHAFLRSSMTTSAKLVALLIATILGAMPVGIFLILNTIHFGDPRPISGILKFAVSQGIGSLRLLNGVVLAYLGLSILGAAASFHQKSAGRIIFVATTTGAVLFVAFLLASHHAEAGSWYFILFAVAGGIGFSFAADMVVARWFRTPVQRTRMQTLFGVVAFAASSFLMLRYGRRSIVSLDDYRISTSLGETARRERIDRIFTFDRPGELAFLDGLSVVAADGLTTNLPFQKALATSTIGDFLIRNDVDAIVLPRIGGMYARSLCDKMYLSTLRFTCELNEATGKVSIVEIEVWSRLTGASLGKVDLHTARRLSFSPDRDLELVLLDKPQP